MVTIVNNANTVEIEFNSLAPDFKVDKLCIEKGGGVSIEIYLGTIKVMQGSHKYEITPQAFGYFQRNSTGLAYTSIADLYSDLCMYLNDRTGSV